MHNALIEATRPTTKKDRRIKVAYTGEHERTKGARSHRICKHLKTGKNYVILMDNVLVESTGQPAIVYKSCDTGQCFVRPASEFFDGRFDIVA
jgi:hypothetical protein